MKSHVRTILVAAGCAVFSGCVSDPFIDDCIREMEAAPMTALLDLPDAKAVAPFAKDKLTGLWETGLYWDWFRFYGSAGLNRPMKLKLQSRLWYFDNAGGFSVHTDVVDLSGMHRTTKESGRYEYEKGLLTLNVQKIDEEWAVGQHKMSGRKDVQEVSRTRRYHLRWLNEDEFIVPAVDFSLSKELGIDANVVKGGDDTIEGRDGSLIERSVTQTGMREGRRIGSVDEKIYAPAHFKRKR